MWTDARHEIDFRTIGGNKLITVAVHAPLFDTVARATLGAEFFDDKPLGSFFLARFPARPELNRCLVALLDEAFTHSDRLSDPDYCRNWEYRVLDAWLARGDRARPGRLSKLAPLRRPSRRDIPQRKPRSSGIRRRALPRNRRRQAHADARLSRGVRNLAGGLPQAASPERGTPRPVSVLPRDVTVAQVALRWGFEHFGRFSVDYHCLFGETPTTTLRG